MCAGNEPDPGFRIEAVSIVPAFATHMERMRQLLAMMQALEDSTNPDPIGHRLRSLLSRTWAALKDFLDPSQFD